MKDKTNKILTILAIGFFIVSVVMLSKGINKMTVYNYSEYSYVSENAYVGGDAYNYIINGTYSTSFFVLFSGFFIGGMICVVTAVIRNAICCKTGGDAAKKTGESERITGIQLPDNNENFGGEEI